MRTGSASKRKSIFHDFVVENYPVSYIMENYGLDEQRALRIHVFLRDGMKSRKAAMLEAGYAKSFAENGFRFDNLTEEKKVINDFYKELYSVDKAKRLEITMMAVDELRKEFDEEWRDSYKMSAVKIGLSFGENKQDEENTQVTQEQKAMSEEEMEKLLRMSGVLPENV